MSLVVPLFNEEDRLRPFVNIVAPLVGTVLCPGLVLDQVVLVDDGSSDGTADQLAELAGRASWTVVPATAGHGGKGDAVGRGARVARCPFLLLSDVDLAAPLNQIAKLAAALSDGAAIAIGSRDLAGSSVTAPKYRFVVGRVFNALVRATTGLDVRDTQCGFKLLDSDLARSLLSSLQVPGLAFDVELLMRARAGGHRVAEVPITYHHGETSRVRPAIDAAAMARDVLRLAICLRLRPALSRRSARARVTV
ncbi:MAG: glycosyltransferase [Actinomycetota bacterium]|nr:glycosyltransferase [Actinomycetota bacterium]